MHIALCTRVRKGKPAPHERPTPPKSLAMTQLVATQLLSKRQNIGTRLAHNDYLPYRSLTTTNPLFPPVHPPTTTTTTTAKMSDPTPPSEKPLPTFDIVSSYRSILASDPDLTMPVAAIEALVEAISHSSVSTVAETLALLEHHTAVLKASIANPISLSAGTDLFQRYLITTLNRPAALNLGPGDDFRAIRNHLLSNGRLFVDRAKQSREKIASFGKHFIRDGATVLTNGGSRVVGALLRRAAESSTMRFRVIYVLSGEESSDTKEGDQTVADLRAHNVPVATIPDSAVAYSLGEVDMVIVGAEGVVENGGIISRLGTYQMGLLARSKGKPFYVVAESHKFVRLYPLSQFDLPIEQKVLDFRVADEGKGKAAKTVVDEGVADLNGGEKSAKPVLNADDAVDFTVCICALIFLVRSQANFSTSPPTSSRASSPSLASSLPRLCRRSSSRSGSEPGLISYRHVLPYPAWPCLVYIHYSSQHTGRQCMRVRACVRACELD